MPKQLKFHEEARGALLRGANVMASAVKATHGAEGPQRRHRQEVRQPHDHQGRRDRRQGDRARGPVREHGRPDAEGSRHEDLRRRGRRDHHRDRARAGDLQGRAEERDGGRRPDGAAARHRQGRRGRGEGAGEALEVHQGQEGDRPGRDDRVEQRRDDRHPDQRGDGEGRQGRRHHRRGVEVRGDGAGRGRGHAVRPRLSLAVLRDGSRAHGSRARGRQRADPREEAQRHEGHAAAARAGRARR